MLVVTQIYHFSFTFQLCQIEALKMALLLGIGILLTATAGYFLHKYLFEAPTLKEYRYPYKEPGIAYHMKVTAYWIREWLLYSPNKRFKLQDLYSADPIKCGIKSTPLQEALESPQKLDFYDTMDEVHFMGVNVTSDELLQVSLARRKGGQSESVVHLVVNHEGNRKEFQLPLLPTTFTTSTDDDLSCWSSRDLKIWCLKPQARWRISFNGFLREKNTDEICHVVFSYVWAPYTTVLDHQDDVSISARSMALAKSCSDDPIADLNSALDQYDQWGTFYGYYSINDGEEMELPLWGSRSRRVGQMNQASIRRSLQIKGYVYDGSVVALNAVSMPPHLPETIWGYVELGKGERHLITKTDLEFTRIETFDSCPSMLSVRFKTNGDHYILDVKSEPERIDYVWGRNEKVKVNSCKARICLTSLYHDLRLEGAGVISLGVKNNDPATDQKLLPPLLLEPVVELSSSTPSILDFSEHFCKSSKLVGGKGSSLAMLKEINEDFTVPDGFCITIAANDRFIEGHELLKNSISKLSEFCCGKIKANIEEECQKIGKIFMAATMPDELKKEIEVKIESMFGKSFEELRFSVRSSAAGEDGEEMSAAGQMETILGCKGLDQVFEGIKKCWASCYGFRAVEYRKQNGQLINVGMGVVIQEMVSSDVAGVLFTRDPVTGNPGVISIAANYGIGESVVSAMSEPDSIVVNRTYDNHLSIGKIDIGKKQMQVHMNDEGGVTETDSTTASASCCMTSDEILSLAQLSLKIEERYGNPRDIEWAIYQHQIYLLQARPITNLFPETETYMKNELNSAVHSDREWATAGNFQEVFPGAASPLSQVCHDTVFAISSAKFLIHFGRGKIPNVLKANGHIIMQQHRLNNRGDSLYANNEKNVSNQMKIFGNGFDIAINGRVIKDGDLKMYSMIRHRYTNKISIFKQLFFSISKIIFVKRAIRKMKEKFGNFSFNHHDAASTEEFATAVLYDFMPHSDAMSYHIDVLIASMAMNSNVLIKLLGPSSEFCDEHYGDFALLMSIKDSSEDVESADVPAALLALAEEIIKRTDADKFVNMSKQEGVQFLSSNDSPVRDSYEDFITRHGHRCVREFDVLSTTWSMEPEKLIVPLQALVRSTHLAKKEKLTIDEALDKLQTEMTASEKKSLKGDVLKARQYVAYREQAKSLLIRTIDQYRKEVVKLSKRMVLEGRIPDEKLIYFMLPEEIIELIRTRSAKIIQRAMKRRRLHPKLDKLNFPEINIGIPKHIEKETSIHLNQANMQVIKGTPVSRGVVEGIARVVPSVEDANHIQPGDILVTNATDIAWSPYFPSLSGVITEIGGLISHGAVVAREYGIPCVVCVENATSYLKSGDMIRLNGNDGTIEKLKTVNESN